MLSMAIEFASMKNVFRRMVQRLEHVGYRSLLVLALELSDLYEEVDINKLEVAHEGDYQGVLHFSIPSTDGTLMYKTEVSYGSCSYCDALESINDREDERERLDGYYTLALHMMQRMEVEYIPDSEDYIALLDDELEALQERRDSRKLSQRMTRLCYGKLDRKYFRKRNNNHSKGHMRDRTKVTAYAPPVVDEN